MSDLYRLKLKITGLGCKKVISAAKSLLDFDIDPSNNKLTRGTFHSHGSFTYEKSMTLLSESEHVDFKRELKIREIQRAQLKLDILEKEFSELQ